MGISEKQSIYSNKKVELHMGKCSPEEKVMKKNFMFVPYEQL